MADFIVLRLVPKEPVDAETFEDYIDGLSFDVRDVSYETAPGAESIVTPGGFTAVVQHVRDDALIPPPNFVAQSVATAVVEIDFPDPEYRQPDVLLVISRGGTEIARLALGYNVAVLTQDDPPETDPEEDGYVRNIAASHVAAYVALTDPAFGGLGFELPEDGSPPRFQDLKDAVLAVLGGDPGTANDGVIAAMTTAQARHVASEIIWHRQVEPLPAPPSVDALENMYTGSGNDEARVQFESALTRFRVEHESRAEALAQFVFALAAAHRAQELSSEAERAGLRFPVRPGAVDSLPGKREEAEVILVNP